MDFDELLKNYQPDPQKIAELAGVEVCLLVGISGAGKDTIKRRLLDTGRYFNFISYTTRAPRSNNGVAEIDGEDYFFITHDSAEQMLHSGEFIEAKEYAGNIYGTGLQTLAEAKELQQTAINDVEVQGVSEYKTLLPQTVAVFILPPSFSEWQKRVRTRYQSEDEFHEVWPKRREAAIRELEFALSVPYYHFVINDDIDLAVTAVDKIVNNRDKFHRKDDEARLLARDILAEILAN